MLFLEITLRGMQMHEKIEGVFLGRELWRNEQEGCRVDSGTNQG